MSDKNELSIIDMDLAGRGIGRHNGKAVFVPDSVTGDTVIYETQISKKRYDIGKLCSIVSKSPHRCLPLCPVFDKCGGCSFMHISRTLELDIKRRSVENAFRRAGIGGITVRKIISCTADHYRNKAIFHLGKSGEYGFFSDGTHTAVTGNSCILVPEIFCKIIKFSEEYFASKKSETPPKDIMLRLGNNSVMAVISQEALGISDRFIESLLVEFPSVCSVYECIGYPGDRNSKFTLHSGEKTVKTDFCGVSLDISPKSFFQVNNEIAEKLCSEIAKILTPEKNDVIIDLYCGIGTIGLTLAKKFPNSSIIGVEINESAINDANKNRISSGIANARFICADAGNFELGDTSPYAIIVDPPRYGLTDSMIKTIIKASPKMLIYMSCDPGTLAGDTSKLIAGGFSVKDCIAGDMFPRCPHVESLVIFEGKRN